MTRVLRRLLAVVFALTSAPAAAAETVVEDVTVTAAIEAACSVMDDVLDFGRYDPLSAEALMATAQVKLSCPEGTRISVRLDGGKNPAGGERRMAGGGGRFLRYNLYTDGDRQQVWGDGTPLGQPVEFTFESSNPYRTVFGLLPGGQPASPGLYSDTVTITVEVNTPPP